MIGQELTGVYDVPHAVSLSIVFGSWATYTYKEKPERFARFAEKVWGITDNTEAAALKGIEKTVEFFKSLEMPTCLSESEVGILSYEALADLALRCSYHDKRTVGSRKQLYRSDLYNIYAMANR